MRGFQRLLAEAQHLVPIREEQVGELTIAWPAMRRAVVRIGEALAARGVLEEADDVFFVTRNEVLTALGEIGTDEIVDVTARRDRLAEQARLVPPFWSVA